MPATDWQARGKSERPRRWRLRSQLFWTLVGTGSAGPVLVLLVSDSPVLLAAAIGWLAVAVGIGHLATNTLMRPVDELRRRLASMAQGDDPKDMSRQAGTPSTRPKRIALFSHASAHGDRERTMELPPELLDVERLGRAGIVSEVAMRSLTKDLSRHLSHQLKSPMALLRAHTESARQELALGDNASATESLAAIDDISMYVAGLVERLLSMAYLNGLEELGLLAKPVNLSPALMNVVRIRAAIGAARKVSVVPDIEAGLWVNGELFLLSEMVACLLDNAVRFSPENGVVHVQCRQTPDTDQIVLRVIDSGPGIPEIERERVFEPFYGSLGLDANGHMTYGTRRDRALKDAAAKSHGLGLAIVRDVARLHGARVQLEDGPEGCGLCARVLLRAVAPPT